MGWFFEERPGHEGFVVGYVARDGCQPGTGLLRELAYPVDGAERADIAQLGAACECGWRSPFFVPRPSSRRPTWAPFSVSADERDEAHAHTLWRQHMARPEGKET